MCIRENKLYFPIPFYAPLQSGLGERMDTAIDKGELEEAAAISDKLAQREVTCFKSLDFSLFDVSLFLYNIVCFQGGDSI